MEFSVQKGKNNGFGDNVLTVLRVGVQNQLIMKEVGIGGLLIVY